MEQDEIYGEFAYVYDEFMDNIPYEQWHDYLHGLLIKYGVTDGIVADLACGTGTMTKLLADDGYDMIGVDMSYEMLEVARQKYCCQDFDEIPVPAVSRHGGPTPFLMDFFPAFLLLCAVLLQIGLHLGLHLVVDIDLAVDGVVVEEGDDLPHGDDGEHLKGGVLAQHIQHRGTRGTGNQRGQAEAEAIAARGQAEAEAIRAKGLAEAEALEKKAEALAKMNEAGKLQMVMDILPAFAQAIAEPMSKIGNVTVIGGGAIDVQLNQTGTPAPVPPAPPATPEPPAAQ